LDVTTCLNSFFSAFSALISLAWVSQAILFHDMLLIEKNGWKNLKYGREDMGISGTVTVRVMHDVTSKIAS
jgi:hypothetical protein